MLGAVILSAQLDKLVKMLLQSPLIAMKYATVVCLSTHIKQ